MSVILGLILAAAIAFVIILRRENNKTRLIHGMAGLRGDAPGGIGVSVLCYGLESVSQVERLLSVEYGRYEAVVVIDSHRAVELFHHIVAHYRMIEVAWNPSYPVSCVQLRGVWRSRSRCFRRLVLVDSCAAQPSEVQGCAAAVASYDFLVPLSARLHLCRGAVERLVAEVAAAPRDTVLLVRSMLGAPLVLVRRDAADATDIAHPKIPRRQMRRIWHVLAYGQCSVGWIFMLSAVFAIAAVFAASAMEGWRTVVLAFVAVAGLAAACYLGVIYSGAPMPEAGKLGRKVK